MCGKRRLIELGREVGVTMKSRKIYILTNHWKTLPIILLRGPTWLSVKVFGSKSRGPGFEPHRILWVFWLECPWARHQSPSLVLVKPREDMNNVTCRRHMPEILLKAA